jgi:hypothetical protein
MRSFCKILSLLILLSANAALASDPTEGAAASAARALQQNQFEPGLALLKKISAPSKFQNWAITEAAKVYYRQQQWPSFFGLASFARQHFLHSSALDEIRLLEILALLRHCQNEAAIEQVRLGLGQSTPGARKSFEMLASLLEVAPTAPDEEKIAQTADRAAGDSFFRGKHLWPVPVAAAHNLDPWKLKRKVETRCEQLPEPAAP